jgi:peptide/nickel transport system ATP-binding protein
MNAPLRNQALLGVALSVSGLRVELDSGVDVVADISFELQAGQILGLVGESGSGKTTVATALLAHVRHGARISAGSIRVGELDILSLSPAALRQARGKLIGHVAQDPAAALNPGQRIGAILDELLLVHERTLGREQRRARIAQAMVDVGLPPDAAFLRRFAHELSGGQQQRVLLALAFLPRPQLIVLDEPTTALDVTSQARVLATIRSLCLRYGVAAVYVSHDLAVVHQLADRVIVLYAGRIVESAPAARLFAQPAHPYSKGLLAAMPDIGKATAPRPIHGQAPAPGTRAPGCAFAPRCDWRLDACAQVQPLQALAADHAAACGQPNARAAGATVRFFARPQAPAAREQLLRVARASAWYGEKRVLFDVALTLAAGECMALVGESGSGKTTFARLLAGLGADAEADIRYGDAQLALSARARTPPQRREIQYVFQNPYRSLNPRHTVGATLRAVLRHVFPGAADGEQRIAEVLRRVALQPHVLDAYPGSLSGGERQRVAIARALLCAPRLLVCDEITSALDVSVQAAIIELLQQLQAQGLAVLFVTHNLGLVRSIADSMLVLRHGAVVERGAVDQVLDHPQHAYTRALIADTPSIDNFQPDFRIGPQSVHSSHPTFEDLT